MTTLSIPQAIDLAKQHHQAGRLREAEGIYRQVLAVEPDHAEALHYLGLVAYQSGQMLDGVSLIRRAIAIDPTAARYHCNLGQVLNDMGLENEAIHALQQALAINPNSPEALSNLGNSLRAQMKLDQAVASYQRAIALSANNIPAHHNLGLTLLLMGDLAQGWPQYEWRPSALEMGRAQSRVWLSGDPRGKRILLRTEQGLGDTLQFIRYVDSLAQIGASVIVESQPELVRILEDSFPSIPVVARGQPLPEFDAQCLLLSLPNIFGTTLQTIPAKIPYLKSEPAKVEAWRDRLSSQTGIKVGLVWSGQSTHQHDHIRSISLNALAPLAEIPGCSFISLQKGEAATQTQKPPTNLNLLDLGPELADFTDTAAALENLDLIITPDTAIAHLAGALGKTVWVLIQHVPDWRWMLDRSDSPWYPTMKLFRQKIAGDWTPVIAAVASSLADRAATPVDVTR